MKTMLRGIKKHYFYISVLSLTVIGLTSYFLCNSGFFHDLSPNLITIGITVFLLDKLLERDNAIIYKEKVIRQLSSTNNKKALKALEIIRENNWHKDGSLVAANLRNANLEEADFSDSVLRRIDFTSAILINAKFQDSVFYYTILDNAKLTGATLTRKNFYRTIINSKTEFSPDFEVPKEYCYFEKLENDKE